MINSRTAFTLALGTLFGSTIFSLNNLNVLAKNLVKTQNNESQEQIYSEAENLISLENAVTEINYRKGGSNPKIPYAVIPRYTLMSNSKPTLRWNQVDGANLYLVKIQGGDINWEKEVSGTSIVYDGEKPLQSGTDYYVYIETDTGLSSLDDEGAKLGFRLITPVQNQSLQQVIAEINQSNLSTEQKTIALAKKYDQLNLNAEAIEMLEKLKANNGKNAEIYHLLGDLYAKTGLNLLAEANYTTAIQLASANNNLQNVTEIQASLAGVKIMLGKFNEAEDLVKQAQAGYSQLGDAQKGQELNRTLVALKEGKNNVIRNTIGTRGSSQPNTSAQEEIDKVVTPAGWDFP